MAHYDDCASSCARQTATPPSHHQPATDLGVGDDGSIDDKADDYKRQIPKTAARAIRSGAA